MFFPKLAKSFPFSKTQLVVLLNTKIIADFLLQNSGCRAINIKLSLNIFLLFFRKNS